MRAEARWLPVAPALLWLLWLPLLVLWGDAPFAVTFDDAYYYFEIGRNLADGLGSTFDGHDPTNGYHPLWMGATTLFYVVGFDDLAAVRAILVGQLAMWSVTLSLVGLQVRAALVDHDRATRTGSPDKTRRVRDGLVLVTLLVLGGNPYVFKLFVNGLESGIASLCYAAILLRVQRVGGAVLTGTDTRWRLVTGALLAAAFLGRTDAVLVIGVLGVWALADARWLPWRQALELFGPPAIAVVGFLATNQAVFGEPTQVSGDIKRLPLTTTRLVLMGLAVAIALVIAVLARRRGGDEPRLPRTRDFLASTAWFASFNVLLIAYYTVLQSFPYLWYFAPAALYGIWLMLLLVADLAEGAAIERPDRGVVASVLPVMAIVLLPVVVGIAYQITQFTDETSYSTQTANRTAGLWISEHLAEDAVIGTFDAGVLGYFTDQRVINLDGVVNSFEYLEAAEEGQRGDFLIERGIDHLANHGIDVGGEDPDLREIASRIFGEGTGEELELVRAFPFRYSGRLDGGGGGSGTKDMAVFVYALPPLTADDEG